MQHTSSLLSIVAFLLAAAAASAVLPWKTRAADNAVSGEGTLAATGAEAAKVAGEGAEAVKGSITLRAVKKADFDGAAPAPAPAPSGPKGVGDIKDFAHLLPFHPRGQQELLMKTRCVNFLNHLLEKSSYAPNEVGDVMPTCKWSKAECKALKDDLLKRLKKSKGAAPSPAAGASLAQNLRPRGPQPDFATDGGMDESIYGWCDTMYDMMRKKAIEEFSEEEKKKKL